MTDGFQIVTEPIDRWPLAPTKDRKSAQFKAGYDDTLKLIREELEWLGAKGNAVIQVVTRNGATDLRRDGMLRAQAKIEHPGVRLSFESMHGPLTYATDAYEQRWSGQPPAWQSNLRAIALSLTALRAVDRYGVSKSGEQYRGWQALESGPAKLTKQQAVDVLRLHGRAPANAPIMEAYRLAKSITHPDRHGGMRGPWDDVERAAKTLGLT